MHSVLGVKGAFVSWDSLRCGDRLLTLNITLAFFRHQRTFQFLLPGHVSAAPSRCLGG